jgi:hypothetical protein
MRARLQCGDRVARVIGVLAIGFFVAVVCAYACTELLLAQLDSRRRIRDRGVRKLSVVVAANLLSFTVVWGSCLAALLVSAGDYYLEATMICLCAQAVWLGQHLWNYYRDHPRLADGEW